MSGYGANHRLGLQPNNKLNPEEYDKTVCAASLFSAIRISMGNVSSQHFTSTRALFDQHEICNNEDKFTSDNKAPACLKCPRSGRWKGNSPAVGRHVEILWSAAPQSARGSLSLKM